MNRAWLHTATTVLLSALHLLIGLAGESLHYLVESARKSPGSISESDVGEESPGYHHFHGPDFHVHYHGPVKHAKSAHASTPAAAETQSAKKQKEASGPSYRKPGQQHEPHACPLLAVVSKLKLGQGGLPRWSLEVSVCHLVDHDSQELALRGCHQFHLARGPPSLTIV